MKEQHGWIIVDVGSEAIEKAKEMRAERDRLYGNIFVEEGTDLRWVGELGEIYFEQWLRDEKISDFEWIREAPAGKPDFKVKGVAVDVKTVKRQVPMRRNYTAQVTARHVHEPISHYFFTCFEEPRNRIWLLGGITIEDFKANARYYGAGEYMVITSSGPVMRFITLKYLISSHVVNGF